MKYNIKISKNGKICEIIMSYLKFLMFESYFQF